VALLVRHVLLREFLPQIGINSDEYALSIPLFHITRGAFPFFRLSFQQSTG
jgi:hypothetical protein